MADVLAAASANANTDVSGLGSAFSYVAPVAGALGFTIEDTTKAIGLMSNSGIKAQKAGTALRKMMNNLSKPTAEAQKLMDEYGISLTDSEGNMKSFDGVMKDLRKGLGDLGEEQQAQAASTLFGQEAMSGALAIVNASEEDYQKLTDSIEGSEGAASDMADTMQDNLQGSLKELKSMLEDLFIEVYQNLKPALESLVDGAKNLTEWFSNLSPATQENIVKFGVLAAAMGPVLSITGKLTFGIGGLMQGAGALTKTIGLSKGAGLLGALSSLGPVAIGGVAVAGLVGVGIAAKNLMGDKKKLNDVSLDTVEAMEKEHSSNQRMIDSFEELRNKTNWSNSEFERYIDLQARLEDESDEESIKKIKEEMSQLQEKSGLSNDEIAKMLGLNDDLVESLPDSTSQITEQGNKVAGSTEKLQEYNDELRKMTQLELEGEWLDALENEEILRGQIAEHVRNINIYKEKEGQINEVLDNYNKDSIKDLKEQLSQENAKLQKKLTSEDLSQQEKASITEQLNLNRDINESLGEGELELRQQLLHLKNQKNEEEQKKQKTKEQMGQLDSITQKLIENELIEAGISEEKAKQAAKDGESFDIINDQISSLKDKKAKLRENYDEGKLSTQEYRNGVNEIENQIDSLEGTKGSINDLHIRAGNLNVELGKDASKRVDMYETGLANINRGATEGKRKRVVVYDDGTVAEIDRRASNPVSKRIRLVTMGGPPGFAKGTPPSGHKGGPAIVGEEGSELISTPKGKTFLSPGSHTMINLPKGTHVTPNKETKRLLKNTPRYAKGTRNWSESLRNNEFMKLLAISNKNDNSESRIIVRNENDGSMKELLNATLQQNELLLQILNKDNNVYLNKEELSSKMKDKLNNDLDNVANRQKAAWGGA